MSVSAPLIFDESGQAQPQSADVLPVTAFEKWYLGLQQKFEKDPNFWKDKEF